MLDLFVPPSVRRLVIYPTPINTRWGLDRLRVLRLLANDPKRLRELQQPLKKA